MKKCACLCFTLLVILVSAIYLPILYEKIFFKQIKKNPFVLQSCQPGLYLKGKIHGNCT